MNDNFNKCNPCVPDCPPKPIPCVPDCPPPKANPCGPDFPMFCPPPMPPIPPMPYESSVVEGSSLYEAVNRLNGRVNVCIDTYNHVMSECYRTLHNLEKAAEENGAYYGPGEVWVEEGYDAEQNSTYKLIHKACVDRRGEPIRVQLHLAYANTTNSKIEQDIFSSSKVEYADKMFVAIPKGENGWYGKAFWHGAPINSSAGVGKYTVGFTRAGAMKVYSNGVSDDQLSRDTIVDAMGCSGVLIQNGQITTEDWQQNIPNRSEKSERIIMGQNMDTQEVVWLVCGNENDVDHAGMTSLKAAQILLSYGVDIAVELSEGADAAATDKGSAMFAPKDMEMPTAYAYWFISRKCFYKNDYDRELAELIQNYGRTLWENYKNAYSIRNLQTDLATEVANRIAGDEKLQGEIDDLFAKLVEMGKRVDALEKVAKELQIQIDDLGTQLTALSQTVSFLQDDVKRLSQRMETIAGLVQQNTTNIQSILEWKETVDNSITNINNSITNITNGKTNLPYIKKSDGDGTGTQLENIYVKGTCTIGSTRDGMAIGATTLTANKKTTVNFSGAGKVSVPAPSALTDAATKKYVDDQIASIGGIPTDLPGRVETLETEVNNIKDGSTDLPYVVREDGSAMGLLTVENMQAQGPDSVFYLDGAKSIRVPTPKENNEAATKEYVDAAVSGGTSDLPERVTALETDVTGIKNGTVVLPYIKSANGTGTNTTLKEFTTIANGGSLLFDDNTTLAASGATVYVKTPQSNTEAANKKYVDDSTNTKMDKNNGIGTGTTKLENVIVSGDTTCNSLHVNGSAVVQTPTDNNEAANKGYVDGENRKLVTGEIVLPYIKSNNGVGTGTTRFENINVTGYGDVGRVDENNDTSIINLAYFLRNKGVHFENNGYDITGPILYKANDYTLALNENLETPPNAVPSDAKITVNKFDSGNLQVIYNGSILQDWTGSDEYSYVYVPLNWAKFSSTVNKFDLLISNDIIIDKSFSVPLRIEFYDGSTNVVKYELPANGRFYNLAGPLTVARKNMAGLHCEIIATHLADSLVPSGGGSIPRKIKFVF